MPSASSQLAQFCCSLQYKDIPQEVVERTLDLFLDWYGSAVAGSNAPPVKALEAFAREMGPIPTNVQNPNSSQLIGSRQYTSPYFAAMVNGAASHVVEQDDLHNQSVLHPATVVFPPLFAVAQAIGVTGQDFITAAVVGYEAGVRVGEFLGREHYRIFHTTGTAGTLASAMAVSSILNLNHQQTHHALGSAGTQAAGLWEFLKDAADSKQLHTAKASSDGLLAAYSARHGLTAASEILEGQKGLAAGMLGEGDSSKLTDRLGRRWGVLETSFKFHASCRHTHPSADALLVLRNAHGLDFQQIKSIKAYVYQAAEDVLGAVSQPETIHQSKFSMGFVLTLIARYGSARVTDFTDAALVDPINIALLNKVEMMVDSDIDRLYPEKWSARVEVTLENGETFISTMDTPKGDPENTLTRQELEQKALMLAQYSNRVTSTEMQNIIDGIWSLATSPSVSLTLPNSKQIQD